MILVLVALREMKLTFHRSYSIASDRAPLLLNNDTYPDNLNIMFHYINLEGFVSSFYLYYKFIYLYRGTKWPQYI